MGFIRMVSVVVALVGVTCVMSQTYNVSTVGCSVTKTCKLFPSSCTTGDSNCIANQRIITWKKAAASSSAIGPLIEIEMRSSPGAGYIAIGFGRFNIMKDADVYYCTSADTFNTAAIISQHSTPASEPLENGVERTASSLIETAINCRFQRIMAVSKPSTTGDYSYDLLKEGFHLLVAEGPTDPNNDHAMRYHNWRTVTADKINFTANFPVALPTTTTVVTSATKDASKQTTTQQTTTQQTTKKETPATSNQTPTTSPATSPEQTTSSALAIQSSFGMTFAIVITTILSSWKC